MNEILEIIKDFSAPCECGNIHATAVQDVQIDSGLVLSVGEILKRNGFSKNVLLVADENTLKASYGIERGLSGFCVQYKIYDNLRVAEMKHVNEIASLIKNRDVSVLSVGSGSINDTCRLACARENKKLCIFATAPSMDGFASYSSPIVDNGFKFSYSAKSPEVIIGDTTILANAPKELKSAGFGDMIAKYVGLIDWQVSALVSNEYYCKKIANLTKSAVDELITMADSVVDVNEKTAGKIFSSLLKTGLGMSFAQSSRPASGSEHIIAHLIECIELRDGIIPNYHGDDVGVATLEMLKYYNELANHETIEVKREQVDFNDVYSFYGNMAEDVKKLNSPTTVTCDVSLDALKQKWGEIRNVIKSVPSYETCYNAMKTAGCKLTIKDIRKSNKLFNDCVKYSPYMRRRITLLRLKDMIVL